VGGAGTPPFHQNSLHPYRLTPVPRDLIPLAGVPLASTCTGSLALPGPCRIVEMLVSRADPNTDTSRSPHTSPASATPNEKRHQRQDARLHARKPDGGEQ